MRSGPFPSGTGFSPAFAARAHCKFIHDMQKGAKCMRSRLSPPSDPLKPRPSSAIIFAGNAVVFFALSLLTQRMIYSFLFAVTFLLFVYEIVALWKQKRTQRGLHRRDYSDAEYRSLGMTRPKKDRRGAVQCRARSMCFCRSPSVRSHFAALQQMTRHSLPFLAPPCPSY